MIIKKTHKAELISQGWTLVDMGLSNKEIKKFRMAVESLRDKAFKINYPLLRSYYPHLSDNNFSAIESPFNKLIINNEVKELFQKIDIGKAIIKLMEWDSVFLHLARLFVNRKYKYLGNWHTDFEGWDGNTRKMETIQVALYLKDQDGFRIINPKFDLTSKHIKSIKKSPPDNPYLPLSLPKNYYKEIKGRAGTLLFFSSGLLHQGNSSVERLDFHFRFSKNKIIKEIKTQVAFKEEPEILKMIGIPEFYKQDFDISNDTYSPRIKKIPYSRKFKNSLNYYTGIINIYRHLTRKSKEKIESPWVVDLLSNTIFQRS